MQFMLICCDSCTFVVVQEMSRFTRFGSQKTVNIGLRAKKNRISSPGSGSNFEGTKKYQWYQKKGAYVSFIVNNFYLYFPKGQNGQRPS